MFPLTQDLTQLKQKIIEELGSTNITDISKTNFKADGRGILVKKKM
jgi:hypothetical protein